MSNRTPMQRANNLGRSSTVLEQNSMPIEVEMSHSTWLVAGIVAGLNRHSSKTLAPTKTRCSGCCTARATRRQSFATRSRA